MTVFEVSGIVLPEAPSVKTNACKANSNVVKAMVMVR